MRDGKKMWESPCQVLLQIVAKQLQGAVHQKRLRLSMAQDEWFWWAYDFLWPSKSLEKMPKNRKTRQLLEKKQWKITHKPPKRHFLGSSTDLASWGLSFVSFRFGAMEPPESDGYPAASASSRRKLFEPHLELSAVEAGLADGSLMRGTLRATWWKSY